MIAEEVAASVEAITTIDTAATIEIQVIILGTGIEIGIGTGFKNWGVTGSGTLNLLIPISQMSTINGRRPRLLAFASGRKHFIFILSNSEFRITS